MERLQKLLLFLLGWTPLCIGSGYDEHTAYQQSQLMKLLHGSSPAYGYPTGSYGHAYHGHHPAAQNVHYSLATRPGHIMHATAGHSHHHAPPLKPKSAKVILDMLNKATRELYAAEGNYAEKIAKASHLKDSFNKASSTLHQILINNEARLEEKIKAAKKAQKRKE